MSEDCEAIIPLPIGSNIPVVLGKRMSIKVSHDTLAPLLRDIHAALYEAVEALVVLEQQYAGHASRGDATLLSPMCHALYRDLAQLQWLIKHLRALQA